VAPVTSETAVNMAVLDVDLVEVNRANDERRKQRAELQV
jgi:hypothetical protein